MAQDGAEGNRSATKSHERLTFLDGLRGLAAAQVVLGHFAGVFIRSFGTPGAGPVIFGHEFAWLQAPIFFVGDGVFAVYIFFMISGLVLTLAFERSLSASWTLIAQRFIRLGGPMVLALLFSSIVMGVLPNAHNQAADMIGGTNSLKAVLHAPYTISEALRQAATSGMLVGYREATVFPDFLRSAIWDDSNSQSLDPPLWTIHFEFWGSILVIALVALSRSASARTYYLTTCLLMVVLMRHTFLAFIIGHLFAKATRSPSWAGVRNSVAWQIVGVVACGATVWACEIPAWGWVSAWYALPGPLKVYSDVNLQGLVAAFFGFSGVMLVTALQKTLARSLPQWLGKISFSVYLLHFPLLFSVAPWIFIKLDFLQDYYLKAFLASAVTIALTLVLSIVFERAVDRPFIALSRLVRSRARSLLIPQHRAFASR